MRSENKNIDQFFRQKEKEATTDLSRLETDWQQMKELLPVQLPAAATVSMGYSSPKKYIAYAAAIILLIALSVVTLQRNREQQKKDIATGTSGKENHEQDILPVMPITDTLVTTEKTAPSLVNPSGIAIQTGKQKDKQSVRYTPATAAVLPENKNQFIVDLNTDSEKNKDKPADREARARKAYEEFYAKLEKPAQAFTIDNESDTTIICAEGTQLFIPAGSFQTMTGASINAVTVTVREFYHFADIISQKLTTSADGKPLETAGMINIEAVANKLPVMLKPGKTLGLKMPTKTFNHNMQLFTGEKKTITAVQSATGSDQLTQPESGNFVVNNPGGINWTSRGQPQAFFANSKKIIKLFNTTDNPYAVGMYRNNTKMVARFAIPYSASISVEDMKAILEEKYGSYYDRIKVKRAWRAWVDRNRSYNGTEKKQKDRVTNIWYESGFVGDSITVPLKYATQFKLISQEDSIAWEAKFKQQLDDAIKYKRSYEDFLEKKKEYSFTISNLGWINCDRFLDYAQSRLTAFIINPGNGFDGTYMNAIMVFKKEKSAMPGYWVNGRLTFPNIPIGHEVTVICAGVKDGKMFTAVKPVRIGKQELNDLVFENSSPEDFRKKLSELGVVN